MSSRSPDRRRGRAAVLGVLVAAATFAGGCRREARVFVSQAPGSSSTPVVTQDTLHPSPSAARLSVNNPAEQNAYATAMGKRLYSQFNCVGCHAHGGGAIGPALMDDQWIYGSEPENVYQTIMQGRPNGMPAFGGRITDQQAWELVAYVRSLSGLLRKDVAPGRSDHMQVKSSEQSTHRREPQPAAHPAGAGP